MYVKYIKRNIQNASILLDYIRELCVCGIICESNRFTDNDQQIKSFSNAKFLFSCILFSFTNYILYNLQIPRLFYYLIRNTFLFAILSEIEA